MMTSALGSTNACCDSSFVHESSSARQLCDWQLEREVLPLNHRHSPNPLSLFCAGSLGKVISVMSFFTATGRNSASAGRISEYKF
ncbi:hypothetical protein KSP40_PGU006966 [Platanthera guangdongensis]|uniref:Uncharacterized protein n=1 Tax=Platanthera guangdongensis TaxID=2320717 RepID=A0ABR2LM85_9ASPA